MTNDSSAAGRVGFVSLGCPACHSAQGAPRLENSGTNVYVPLGGSVTREKSYVELVTAVINPSHRISSGGFGQTSEVVDGKRALYHEAVYRRPFGEPFSVQGAN